MPFTSETASEAGKKSKRGPSVRVKILNDLFDSNEESAKEIFMLLQAKAKEGDMDAIKTYMAYCYGKPEAKMDLTTDGEQILGFSSFPTSRPAEYKSNGNGISTKSGTL